MAEWQEMSSRIDSLEIMWIKADAISNPVLTARIWPGEIFYSTVPDTVLIFINKLPPLRFLTKGGRLAFFLLLALLLIPVQAETSFSLSGYYKSFFVVFDPPPTTLPSFFSYPEQQMGLVNNRLRLNITYDLKEELSFSLSYNILPRIQDPKLYEETLTLTQVNLFQYRWLDLRRRLYPAEEAERGSFAVFQNLDRAFLTLRSGDADIFIGRQAIAWGSGRVINPTDVVAPFSFEELDTEDRVGVDAVRIRVPLGFMGELDTGYIIGKDFKLKNSAFFVRSKFHLAKTDFSFLLMEFQENLMLGWDLARSIGGAGFWFEGAYVFVDVFRSQNQDRESGYLRTTIGLDYSFGGETYGFIEYHFSSAGARNPEDYLQNVSRPGRREGAVYLMGRHYLIPGFSHQFSPLFTFSGQVLINLSDLSLFFTPQVDYNISANIYLSAGAFIGMGKRPEIQVQEGGFLRIFHSEFGGYPDIYFSSFRIYF